MLLNCHPEAHPRDEVEQKSFRLGAIPRLGPRQESLKDLRSEGGEVGVVVRVAEGEEVDGPQQGER